MWSLMPRSQVSVGFFRIQMLIVMGLGVLAALTFGELPAALEASPLIDPAAGPPICIALAIAGFLGSAFWTLGRRKIGTGFVFAIPLGSGTLLAGSTMASANSSRDWMFVAGEIATAASLGGAMTGMLLGHWYLTAPTMSI